MEEKMKYEKPEMKIVLLVAENVIVTSTLTEVEIGSGNESNWDDLFK